MFDPYNYQRQIDKLSLSLDYWPLKLSITHVTRSSGQPTAGSPASIIPVHHVGSTSSTSAYQQVGS